MSGFLTWLKHLLVALPTDFVACGKCGRTTDNVKTDPYYGYMCEWCK